MSEVQQELEMESPASAEDKFFGVRTTIGKKVRLVKTSPILKYQILSTK